MSEFREDPISGDWVIIAPGRAARPIFLEEKKKKRTPGLKKTCPFEHLEKSGNWPPLLAKPSAAHWRTVAIPNKYPALAHAEVCSEPFEHGIYRSRTGVGRHELVITRDHSKNLADLSPAAAAEVFRVFQERCLSAAEDKCLSYVVPFFNWGLKAGASVAHPHFQILALPIVPEHSARSHANAMAYRKTHGSCVRCDIIAMEKKEKKRVVHENANAIAIAPYASKFPFEIRIKPKRHYPYFRTTPAAVIRDVASLTQKVMRGLKAYANDPDLNFFVHEAPIDGKRHEYHHWHIEVLPRVSIPAGFEFSSGIYINIVDPDFAAAVLRGEKRR